MRGVWWRCWWMRAMRGVERAWKHIQTLLGVGSRWCNMKKNRNEKTDATEYVFSFVHVAEMTFYTIELVLMWTCCYDENPKSSLFEVHLNANSMVCNLTKACPCDHQQPEPPSLSRSIQTNTSIHSLRRHHIKLRPNLHSERHIFTTKVYAWTHKYYVDGIRSVRDV